MSNDIENKQITNSREEIHPRLLANLSLHPFVANASPPRLYMFSGHLSQSIIPKGHTPRFIITGTEFEYAKTTFGVTTEEDIKVLKLIPRYKKGYGDEAIANNPEYIMFFEKEEIDENGIKSNVVDIYELPKYHSAHEDFGFEFDYINLDGNVKHIPAGTTICKPPTVDEDGNYHIGIEAVVAAMTIPEVAEDGSVISESFAKKLETTGMETYVITFGSKKYPLNIYGDYDTYKIIPDIGDKVRDDGLLVALRNYDDLNAPAMMSRSALRKASLSFDERVFTKPNAEVINVKVYADPYKRGNVRAQYSNTPEGTTTQLDKYLNADQVYYKSIIEFYKSLFRGDKHPNISRAFHRLVVEAYMYTVGGDASKIRRLHGGAQIDEWRIEITVKYPIYPTVGYKFTGTHGDKGVIVTVWPDDRMPVDQAGNRADVIVDPLSTIKRMIPSRVYEQYINASGSATATRLLEMIDNNVSYSEVSNYLVEYYKIISPKFISVVLDQDGLVKRSHMNYVIAFARKYKNIVKWIPTNGGLDIVDAITKLSERYPAVYGPVTYKTATGKTVKTISPVLLGTMTLLLLEKTGKKWSGVSSVKLNHFGTAAKLSNLDKYSLPGRNQPTRCGESEHRLLASMVEDSRYVTEFTDKTNNMEVRRQIYENMYNTDSPYTMESIFNRDKYESGHSRTSQSIRHIFECQGFYLEMDEGDDADS